VFQIRAYDLDVDIYPYNPRSRRLHCRAEVNGVAETDGLSSVRLFLYQECQITSLTIENPGGTWQRLPGEMHPQGFAGTALELQLSEELRAGDEFSFSLEYTGGMSGVVWGYCMIGRHLVELRDFACWYPISAGNIRGFSFDLRLSLPHGYMVVTNGEHFTRPQRPRTGCPDRAIAGDVDMVTTHWRSSSTVTDINIVASPLFRLCEDSTGRCRGRLYYALMSDQQAEELLKTSLEVVEYYSQLWGDNEKTRELVWVYCPRFAEGGYVYGNLATMDEPTALRVFHHPEEMAAFGLSLPAFTAHETAHFWWREQVTTDRLDYHEWLMEGLAQFYTVETGRVLAGQDDQTVYLKYEGSINALAGNRVMAETRFESDNRYVLWYEKGAWIIRMLREVMGYECFRSTMRRFYRENSGRQVTTQEFQQCCEEAYGAGLSWFFDQWLCRPDLPSFSVTAASAKGHQLEIGIHQEVPCPFTFPLEVEVRGAEGDERSAKLNVTGRKSVKYLDVTGLSYPLEVNVDPGVKVLMSDQARLNRRLSITNP